MKVLELGDVNGKYRYSAFESAVEGDYIGFAIGPDSLVDMVQINGRTLTAGRVLALESNGAPVVEPIRSLRTHTTLDPQPTTPNFQVNTRCQLIGYERCDRLPAFVGPRNPVLRDAAFVAGAGYVRALRLPFQGRSMAQFGVAHDALPGDAAADQYLVYGVKYIPRGRLFSLLQAGSDSTSYVYQLGVGTFLFAVDTPTGSTGEAKATVFYVGGTNEGESYDELEVYINTPSANGRVWGEAYDRATVGAL